MLFPSPVFLFVFLPLLLAVYYALMPRVAWRNLVLLLASVLFYAWGEPLFVIILLLSVVVNHAFGLCVGRCQSEGKRGKGYVVAAVVFNVALLFVFKYLNFTVDSANLLLGTHWEIRRIALPVGISFFTFQSLSYVIDIYRQRCVAQPSVMDVGLYVTLFPQLIAGPIVRYETVMQELVSRRTTLSDFSSGIELFVQGLAKKVLVAQQRRRRCRHRLCLAGRPFVNCGGVAGSGGLYVADLL